MDGCLNPRLVDAVEDDESSGALRAAEVGSCPEFEVRKYILRVNGNIRLSESSEEVLVVMAVTCDQLPTAKLQTPHKAARARTSHN